MTMARSPSAAAMPFRKVLLTLDLSERGKEVLRVGASLLAAGADVTIVHVSNVQTNLAGNESDGSPANPTERDTLGSLRNMAYEAFGERSDSVKTLVLHGEPAGRICEYAEYLGCDLIILSSRRQGQLKKALLGSVSSEVAARATVAVLILK